MKFNLINSTLLNIVKWGQRIEYELIRQQNSRQSTLTE